MIGPFGAVRCVWRMKWKDNKRSGGTWRLLWHTCNVKWMNEFAGLTIEAREAKMEAMLLARRRSEERRGGGNENKRLMEEEMAACERDRGRVKEARRG